jgi:hypothetical protein
LKKRLFTKSYILNIVDIENYRRKYYPPKRRINYLDKTSFTALPISAGETTTLTPAA